MTTGPSDALRERLSRLDSGQIVRLVTGLQERLDALRAQGPQQPSSIAVIGLGCRFPGAPDVDAFRRLLNEGRDAVGQAPEDRPERAALPMGGYIDGIDRFDAGFFGLRASEAAHMDPQHRLVLEEAWHALEDAGAANAQRRPRRTGVFLGISTHDYEARFHSSENGFTPQVTTGNAASAAAGRLAHLLNMTGPALSIDTACSSSLVAVLAACRSLRLGECDMAIAGGVNVLVDDAWTRGFAAAGMLSPSHACKTFDSGADGYVRGEGAGFIVLKRLDDARRNGDRVRAVVRGGAVNHDGRASSLTAPNASAQQELIEAALADAGLAAADVQVVECHGTGTPLGDPIEVQALAAAYAPQRRLPLLLGAVKTNIGHLEAAAGIAGIIKTVLSLESASLPPTLHQASPNPRIAWGDLPVRVVDRAQAWPDVCVRRAGVSSFGFSGTNAHLILESAEPLPVETREAAGRDTREARETAALETPAQAAPQVREQSAPEMPVSAVLTLSAPDEAGLGRLGATLAGWLENSPAAEAARVAASLAIGRRHFPHRAAVVADDMSSAIADLRAIAASLDPSRGARGAAGAEPPKIAFLFTGQGSQWVGMGGDLYGGDPVFRAAIDRCAAIVDPLIGRSLTAVMFHDDAKAGLSDTRLTQPALFALGYALAERLEAWGIVPDVMIGHSLGEWTAAYRAGVFSLDEALRLVTARGRAMASASEDGAMAAVFGGPGVLSDLPEALRRGIDLAAVNAPDECVISGPAQAVAAACDALDALGVGTQRLRTSHGFHSRLMDPALDDFAKAFAGTRPARPRMALVSNVTGGTDAPFDTADYWVRHIRQPVRFADGMAAVAARGVDVLIEVGASPALIGSASRIPAFQDKAPAMVPTLRRQRPGRDTLAGMLAHLYTAGVPVRWDVVYEKTARTDVPGYPFADTRHWLGLAPSRHSGRLSAAETGRAQQPDGALSASGGGAKAGAGADSGGADADDGKAANAAGAPVDVRAETAALLARLLQIAADDTQTDTGFLELGVDSLALTEAVAALERRWSIAIPRRALFEELGTPARLVDHVVANAKPDAVRPSGQQAVSAAVAPATKIPAEEIPATGMPATGIPATGIPEAGIPEAAMHAAASGAVGAAVSAPVAPPVNQAVAASRPMSPEMAAGVAAFSATYTQRTRASGEQRRRYGPNLADSRAVAGFRPETRSMLYPIVGARGAGSHMVDVDGNEYVDIAMGFGVQLFGHTPPFLADAIVRHISDRGLFIGPQAHLAGDVAQRLCRLTGNARATFCNSGTEAVMTALRLARHATGRRRIAMFQGSYHGHFDGTLTQIGADGATVPMAGGTPPGMVQDVIVLDYGDERGSLEILEREGASLAAVIVEPVQGRRPDHQPREFLQRLRRLTESVGAALIFDEVLLGFRVALGGAQAWADVRADLVTYGKIVGGGLPIGLVAGEARFLDALDGGAWSPDGGSPPRENRTFFAGTFNKNPLAMANAQAVLAHLEAQGPGLQESLNRRTDHLAERLNAVLAQEESGMTVHHFASLFRFIGASDLFYSHMIHNGVYVWEGRTCFLSTAHSDDDLDRIEQAVRASVRAMRAGGMLARTRRRGPSEATSMQPAPTQPTSIQPELVQQPPAIETPPPAPGVLPTTAGQAALRLLAAFSPQTSAAYNQSLIVDFSGRLDLPVLTQALRDIVHRHEALRTTFPEDGATQRVHEQLDPDVRVVDHTGRDDDAFQAWLDDTVLAPLNLDVGPMVVARILKLAEHRHRLVLIMPHLVTDGWSMQLLAMELASFYNARRAGREAGLGEAVPYRRYVEHTRARADLPETGAYWKDLYRTVPAPLQLPADRARPPLQGYAGRRASLRVPPSLREALGECARSHGSSLFSLCLAAFGRLLARLSGQDDTVVAIFSAGQPELGATALAGYCVGVLPIRIAASAAVPDRQLVKAVQRAVVQGMAHRDYPFSRLIKDLGLKRDPSRPPLASVSFNLDRLDDAPRFDGLETRIDANAHSAVRWDLNWNVQADADGLRIDAHYNSDLFDAARIQSWLDEYAAILSSLAGAPDPNPDPGPSSNAGPRATEASDVASLAGRVHDIAAQTPRMPAVRDSAGAVDYAGLDARANALAARLAQAGVGRGDRVAFRLARGLGPVVAIVAAGRLGAAFVPLDPEHPDSHHGYVIDDSGARVLVVDAGSPVPATDATVLAWSRNDAPTGGVKAPSVEVPPVGVAADDIAYVLYTSGSTGRPKGVRVPYGAVAAYATALLERLAVPGPASFAIVSSFAADLGYTCVLGALWSGGALHVIDAQTARDPAALQAWAGQAPIDVLKIVPPHLAALLDAPDAVALLPRKALILGGDTLPWRLVDRIRAMGACCRIYNHYGPTETTVGACMGEALDSMRQEGVGAVPIGYPLSGYRIDILDDDGRPVPDGSEGEIVISGAAVAAGYTRPQAPGGERFGHTGDGHRRYRTGDLGYRRADGALGFVGRRDDMVKIRGHRIEPAGLAELLRTGPGVRDAVVLVERREGREPTLLAAVAGSVAVDGLRAWLARHVPAAMVPGKIIVCEALPLTPNGKIDRQALLAGAGGGAVDAAVIDPACADTEGAAADLAPTAANMPAQAAREETAPKASVSRESTTPASADAANRLDILCGLWRDILQQDNVGPDDDFFALGGDSIMAIQLVGRARAAGLGLTPTQVFEAPTPRGQARLAAAIGGAVAGAAALDEPVPLTPIQRWFLETPMPHRNRWCLSAVFAVPASVSRERLEETVRVLIARHDALRMRCDAAADNPRQQIAATVPVTVVLAEAEGDAASHDAMRDAQDSLADQLMDTLDLEAGHVFAVGAINHGGGADVVVAVHHAVSDMVSWSILADDLETGLLRDPSAIARASTSWSWWARAQSARSQAVADRLPYWENVVRQVRQSAPLPVDDPDGANCEGDARECRLQVAAAQTEHFLFAMSSVFGFRSHEAVLALVAAGLAEWAGAVPAIELEGHGRVPFDAAIDLSRTVGWFTTRYPVVLPGVDVSDTVAGWLVAVKEAVRAIPDSGMSYGLLRYGAQEPLRAEPGVSFNFVGEISQFGGRGMTLRRLGAGRERAADAGRRHLLAFDAWLSDGGLVLSCRFGARHAQPSIQAALGAIETWVGRLAQACDASSAAVYSPSDFTGMDFSQDELDQLMGEIDPDSAGQ
jgi:amino acid adenylation domain-containing protein/non-ribosomal peptide synthase protein (TIGR01720 family)